jgi:hypothetical protein
MTLQDEERSPMPYRTCETCSHPLKEEPPAIRDEAGRVFCDFACLLTFEADREEVAA